MSGTRAAGVPGVSKAAVADPGAAVAAPSLRPARPADLPAVIGLLGEAGLPTVEVERWLDRFVVAEAEDIVVGAVGLEVHGAAAADAVLRSAVVAPSWRGRGLGDALTQRVLEEGARAGVRRVYLLTTTAADFFPRHGFRRIEREEASAEVRESVEFREACPASATVMVRSLEA